MPDDPREPIEIYRARGLPEAYAIRGLLEAAGIPVRVENEMLQGALGDLPMGWSTAPRIMVEADQARAAENILNEFLDSLPPAAADDETANNCLACGAPMGKAVVCPACGWTYMDKETFET